MISIRIDKVMIYDIDTVAHALSKDILDYTMTLEAADWWSSQEEKRVAAGDLLATYRMLDLLNYDFGETE